MEKKDVFSGLSKTELNTLSGMSTRLLLSAGTILFSEGDVGNAVYIIETGNISIFLNKSEKQEEIAILGCGEFFGEMAIFNNDTRGASAKALSEAVLWEVKKDDFIRLTKDQPAFAAKLLLVLQSRKIELFLKEQLVSAAGIGSHDLRVSIKGDPSLRETAFTRERYESVVDKILPSLVPNLRTLLFDTSVYQVFIGFNNGEVRTCSVITPYIEEVHTASKIVSAAYIDRHFAPLTYESKTEFIREMNIHIQATATFKALPHSWHTAIGSFHTNWNPVPREKLESVLDHLLDMRQMPNFYLRNLGLSVVQDAIRMQFNCDGTHIISTREYQRFLEENIDATI